MLVHTTGALKSWPRCLRSPLDAAHIYCSTVHLHNICEKIRRVLQQGVQSLASLHACMGSQQRHSSVLWLDRSIKKVTCVLMIDVSGWPLWCCDKMWCCIQLSRAEENITLLFILIFHYNLWIQLPYFYFFLQHICTDVLSNLTNLCRHNKVLE